MKFAILFASLVLFAPLAFCDEAADQKLIDAAVKGDLSAVREALAEGANVNATAYNDYSALMGAIYADQLEVARELLAQPALNPFGLTLNNSTVYDYVETKIKEQRPGWSEFLKELEVRIASIDERALPEHYLVINYLGFGGGGRISEYELQSQSRVDKIFPARRSREDTKEIKETIEKWMRFDQSQGGPRSQTIIVIGASWSARSSKELTNWFNTRFKIKPALHVLIEGATILGLPYGIPFGRMGNAETTINYHIEGLHWPRGAAVKNAGKNVNLGNMSHNDGLAFGAMRTVEEIMRVLGENRTRCGELLGAPVVTKR